MNFLNAIDYKLILYVLGSAVALYLTFVFISIILKGWGSLTSIWFWTKKIGWIFVILIGLFFALRALRKKTEAKNVIDTNLSNLQKIEDKTQADKQREAELIVQKKEVEQSIVVLAKKYQDKVDSLNKRPDDKPTDPPGHAGQSYEDLKNSW
jgi:amino acid permease